MDYMLGELNLDYGQNYVDTRLETRNEGSKSLSSAVFDPSRPGIENTAAPGMYTDTDEVTGNVDRITSGPEYSSSVYDWSAALHPSSSAVSSNGGTGFDLMKTISGMISPKSKVPGTSEAKSTSTALIIGGMAVAGVLAVIILSKG